MGWETRGGRRYYYRARKVGGRVVKEYLGTGRPAEIAALQDAWTRQDRAAAANARRAERAGLEAVDGEMKDIDDVIEAMTQASLVLAGYHRHHGGEWRRRRHG